MRINNLNLFTDSIFSMRKGKKKLNMLKKPCVERMRPMIYFLHKKV